MKLTSTQKGYIIDKLFIDNLIEKENLEKIMKKDFDQIAINETKEIIEMNSSIIKILKSQM